MKRYSKVYKVIALWNSYNSLEGSDCTYNKEVIKAMDYCLDEITRLGYNVNRLPSQIDELIDYLFENK